MKKNDSNEYKIEKQKHLFKLKLSQVMNISLRLEESATK